MCRFAARPHIGVWAQAELESLRTHIVRHVISYPDRGVAFIGCVQQRNLEAWLVAVSS